MIKIYEFPPSCIALIWSWISPMFFGMTYNVLIPSAFAVVCLIGVILWAFLERREPDGPDEIQLKLTGFGSKSTQKITVKSALLSRIANKKSRWAKIGGVIAGFLPVIALGFSAVSLWLAAQNYDKQYAFWNEQTTFQKGQKTLQDLQATNQQAQIDIQNQQMNMQQNSLTMQQESLRREEAKYKASITPHLDLDFEPGHLYLLNTGPGVARITFIEVRGGSNQLLYPLRRQNGEELVAAQLRAAQGATNAASLLLRADGLKETYREGPDIVPVPVFSINGRYLLPGQPVQIAYIRNYDTIDSTARNDAERKKFISWIAPADRSVPTVTVMYQDIEDTCQVYSSSVSLEYSCTDVLEKYEKESGISIPGAVFSDKSPEAANSLFRNRTKLSPLGTLDLFH